MVNEIVKQLPFPVAMDTYVIEDDDRYIYELNIQYVPIGFDCSHLTFADLIFTSEGMQIRYYDTEEGMKTQYYDYHQFDTEVITRKLTEILPKTYAAHCLENLATCAPVDTI